MPDIRHLGKLVCWYAGCLAAFVVCPDWTTWETAAPEVDRVLAEFREHLERHARAEDKEGMA